MIYCDIVWRKSLAGKRFGEFGESFVIRQTKKIFLVTINNPLADLFIHQTL